MKRPPRRGRKLGAAPRVDATLLKQPLELAAAVRAVAIDRGPARELLHNPAVLGAFGGVGGVEEVVDEFWCGLGVGGVGWGDYGGGDQFGVWVHRGVVLPKPTGPNPQKNTSHLDILCNLQVAWRGHDAGVADQQSRNDLRLLLQRS